MTLKETEGPDEYYAVCPVCDSEGVLTGNADYCVGGSDEAHLNYGLNFFLMQF